MERTPKGIYTPEFRAEAAKQLSMPKSSLDNWVRAAREGKLAEVGKGQRTKASHLETDTRRSAEHSVWSHVS